LSPEWPGDTLLDGHLVRRALIRPEIGKYPPGQVWEACALMSFRSASRPARNYGYDWPVSAVTGRFEEGYLLARRFALSLRAAAGGA